MAAEVDTQRTGRPAILACGKYETHAGEDVAAFAVGVNAPQVRSVMEQNALFEVMRTALLEKPAEPIKLIRPLKLARNTADQKHIGFNDDVMDDIKN